MLMEDITWNNHLIDAHGLKTQGRGYLMFFAKIPREVKALRKNWLEGSPYFRFYCIFFNKCCEICLRGGPIFTLPPVCIPTLSLSSVLILFVLRNLSHIKQHYT